MNDFRFALRRFVKNATTTFVIVMTLAIAIAATAVIASTIDVVWRAIPAARSDRLVFVSSTDPGPGQSQSGVIDGAARTGTSIPDLVDWSERTSSFEELAGFATGSANLTGTDAPLRVTTVRVTSNLFPAWGIRPVLGRGFRRDESAPGAACAVVLGYAFWERQFSRRPDILGRSLVLDGEPHMVVGVLPSEAGVGLFNQRDVFVPVVLDQARAPRDARRLFVTGVLKPGVTREQAAAELRTVARQLQKQYPATNAHTDVVVRPLMEMLGPTVQFLLFLLVFIAALVLGIACANISNVILARETTRRREFAIRAALGASRFHQIRQLMAESFVVSFAAGALGLLLAWWGVWALRAAAGHATLGFGEIALSGRVLAAGVIVAFLAPSGFALVPAIRLSKPAPEELRQGNRGPETRAGRRLRELLVAFQVALALILMVQVGLIVRTTWRLHNLEKGFDPTHVLTMRIDLPAEGYQAPKAVQQFFTQAIARIQTLPDVASAGLVTSLPIADREVMVRFAIEGTPPSSPEMEPLAAQSAISSDYLATMKIPMLQGRAINSTDVENLRAVALVNREAARRYWPGQTPLGKRVAFKSRPGEWLEIVGVVGNVRNSNAGSDPTPQILVPVSWQPQRAMAIVVRSRSAEPAQLTAAIRAQLARIDKDQPIYDVSTMARVLFDDMGGTYLLTDLLMAIGFVSLCLAGGGIYGLVSYSVSQRTREIGLRMALGAQSSAVRMMVLRQGSLPIAVGLMVGAVGATALAYAMASAMGEIDLRDPIGYVCILGPFIGLALLAGYLPARRATQVDPILALKAE